MRMQQGFYYEFGVSNSGWINRQDQ